MKTKILFVCQGNIFRSPIAAAFFQKEMEYLGKGDHFEVRSAGVSPSKKSLDKKAVGFVHGFGGGKFFKESSEQVEKDHMDWADLIIAMETPHKEFMAELEPETERKIGVWGIPDVIEDLENEAFGITIELKERSECLANELAWEYDSSSPWLEEIGVKTGHPNAIFSTNDVRKNGLCG